MTDSYLRDDLSLETRVVLRSAAARLQQQFDGVFGSDTIERFLHGSYDDFAGRMKVVTWLPLLAERFARDST